MNRDVMEGNWKQLKGLIKERWARLTDDQLDMINGKRDRLVGKLQEVYGETKDEIEKQMQEFEELRDTGYSRHKTAGRR